MKTKITLSFASLLILFLLISGSSPKQTDLIRLRFSSNYPSEKTADQKTGLLWALSYLGATLPKNCLHYALKQKDSTVFELDLSKVGFNKDALTALRKLVISLKESEEYQVKLGIDLGEFITYTLGSSWHYYEITAVPRTLKEYKQKYPFKNRFVFPVLKSDVAFHHRLIEMTNTTRIKEMSFIAHEGTGDLRDSSFVSETFEVFDIMPNGQLRFAVYSKSGELIEVSDRKYGNAGKPIKCLWCHEINIQPLFNENAQLPGQMSPTDFNNQISRFMKHLQIYRADLASEIDFTKKQDHALMEILYISFMQPSMYKLGNEWGSMDDLTKEHYNSLKTHDHDEYDFLKQLLHRSAIKKLYPYKTVQLPDSIWELNASEPNLFEQPQGKPGKMD